MAAGKFMKAGGMAALAAGLALVAVPASAQDRGQWRGGGDAAQSSPGGGGRGNRGGEGGAWQGGGGWQGGRGGRGGQVATPAPQAPPQVQAQPQPQAQPQVQAQAPRAWSGGNGGGTGWRGRGSGTDGGQPAQAQRNWSRGDANGSPAWRGRGDPADVGQAQRNWSRGSADQGNAQWQERNRSYVDPERNRSYRDSGRDTFRGGNDANRWRTDRQAYRGGQNTWNRDWRRDNRYDWQGYRNQNRNIYRQGAYYAPYRNYSYRRLSTGFYLDTLFFGSRYWINDPWAYRLPPADGGYRWVRYYDDALLVDTYSGEVVDTIYDFFW